MLYSIRDNWLVEYLHIIKLTFFQFNFRYFVIVQRVHLGLYTYLQSQIYKRSASPWVYWSLNMLQPIQSTMNIDNIRQALHASVRKVRFPVMYLILCPSNSDASTGNKQAKPAQEEIPSKKTFEDNANCIHTGLKCPLSIRFEYIFLVGT